MLFHIVKFLRGYVKISVYGYSPERFLNLCSNHNILIWNLKNCGETYEMYMSVKAFRQLKPLVKKTKTRVHIMERHGIPFWMYRYRKHKMFFVGLGISLVLIYGLSLFIWDIQFNGNSKRTTETLMEYLESQNVHHGMFKNQIDCEKVESMLRNQFDDIIWASVELKGTRLIIYVQESLEIEENQTVDEDTPSDLCAGVNGTIERIITRSGKPLVDVGTPVSEGAVLVQGRLEITGDDGNVVNYRYCAADADIFVRTAYPYEDTFSMQYEEKEYDEKKRHGCYVRIFDKEWKLDFWNPDEKKDCETVVEETQLHLWNNFYLPFYWGNTTHNYYKKIEKTYTREQAEQIAQKKLEQFCEDLQKKGVQIVQNNVTIQVDEMSCKASGVIEVIEQTGVRKPTEVLELQQEENNEHNRTDY